MSLVQRFGPMALALVLLGALVWALNPRQPKFVPAPLEERGPGCPRFGGEFVPSNITGIPDPALTGLNEKQKNRALLRMNLELCPCGCNRSIASCRVHNPECITSRQAAAKIIEEVKADSAGQ